MHIREYPFVRTVDGHRLGRINGDIRYLESENKVRVIFIDKGRDTVDLADLEGVTQEQRMNEHCTICYKTAEHHIPSSGCSGPFLPRCGCNLPTCVANGSKWPCVCIVESSAIAAMKLVHAIASHNVDNVDIRIRKQIQPTGIFARGSARGPTRKLQISRFDPGEHFYLRFPHGIMPGGDRATDVKYDTIDVARAAAAELGYGITDTILVVDSNGNETTDYI